MYVIVCRLSTVPLVRTHLVTLQKHCKNNFLVNVILRNPMVVFLKEPTKNI